MAEENKPVIPPTPPPLPPRGPVNPKDHAEPGKKEASDKSLDIRS